MTNEQIDQMLAQNGELFTRAVNAERNVEILRGENDRLHDLADENACNYSLAIEHNNELEAQNARLLSIATKMHTWIFLHTFDEEAAYKELGLTDEENAMFGYEGKLELRID